LSRFGKGEAAPLIEAWDKYLATSRGSEALFNSIDTDKNNRVSPGEISDWMTTVERKGLNDAAWETLQNMRKDQELSLEDFRSWLIDATKLADSNDTSVTPSGVGEQCSSKPVKSYSLNESTMSQSLRKMQYAVRGEVVMKADQLAAEGMAITYTNIGNPHAVGQKPLTYYRQVMALCDLPAECGVDHPNANQLFPADVIERAKEVRAAVGECGTGSYTNSQGIMAFREDIKNFIEARDGGIPAYTGDIFMSNGASSAIQAVLTATFASDHDALMIPIPQYPIYSALVALLGGRQVGYELDESQAWGITTEELEAKLSAARAEGLNVKALAMINPGNPTGQVMSRQSLEAVCLFCAKHGILLLSDEVYQRNVYAEGAEFISAKKIAFETPGCENLELVSFHSTSKGLIGECGRRGGYMELVNIDPAVKAQLYKLASSGLCSNVPGQIFTSLMVRGPKEGGESFESHAQEEEAIYESLKRKAKLLVDGLNAIPGIACESADGAMYAFPRIEIPQRAIDAARASGTTPDNMYALSLLEATGLCVVPASGFGQAEGRFGFRTTFLPSEEELEVAVTKFADHHAAFCATWASDAELVA